MGTTRDMFKKLKGIYIVYFEIILICRTIGPLILMPNVIDKLFFVSSGLIGIGIIGIDFIFSVKEKNWKKYDLFLILFLVVMCISSLMNMNYGIFENIKMIMWQAIYFLIIFQYGKDYGKKDKMNSYFQLVLMISWFFSAIVSLGMFIIQYGVKIPMSNRYYPLRMGFLGNRLFGVFPDPNFGATISVVVIILSVYYLLNKADLKNWMKAFHILNIIFQIMFISLSGSRSAVIVLLIVLGVATFFTLLHSEKVNVKNSILKFLIAVAGAVIVAGISYLMIDMVKSLLSYLPGLLHPAGSEGISGSGNANRISLDRPDVSEGGDVSNLRFSLWSSAIEIFKSSWLFGASPMNYIPYAHDLLPFTFIGRNTLTVHNFVFLVLATTGLAGMITFFTFFLNKVFISVKYLFKRKNLVNDLTFYYILSILAIAVSALFITELILVSTIGSVVFWFFVGVITNSSKEIEDHN